LTLYSNDQLVNLSRPITVVISGSVAYEGIIQSTVRTFLLEDFFRQDPRTLYPASLTINVPAGNNEEEGRGLCV
jgi:hypothetical protein